MTFKPLFLALALVTLAVHPEGELTLDTKTLTPGMMVHLMGKKFPKGETIDILIAGPAKRTSLKQITTDDQGAFHDFVVVPEGLPPGSYRLVLIAQSDDDEVAAVDVQLTAGSSTVAGAPSPPPEHDMAHMGASAEPLQLARARSPLVTGGAYALIVIAIAIGAVAVLRPRAA